MTNVKTNSISDANVSFNSFMKATEDYKKFEQKNSIANLCQFVEGSKTGFIKEPHVYCPTTNKPNTKCVSNKDSPNNYNIDMLPNAGGPTKRCNFILNHLSTPLTTKQSDSCSPCPSGYVYDKGMCIHRD